MQPKQVFFISLFALSVYGAKLTTSFKNQSFLQEVDEDTVVFSDSNSASSDDLDTTPLLTEVEESTRTPEDGESVSENDVDVDGLVIYEDEPIYISRDEMDPELLAAVENVEAIYEENQSSECFLLVESETYIEALDELADELEDGYMITVNGENYTLEAIEAESQEYQEKNDKIEEADAYGYCIDDVNGDIYYIYEEDQLLSDAKDVLYIEADSEILTAEDVDELLDYYESLIENADEGDVIYVDGYELTYDELEDRYKTLEILQDEISDEDLLYVNFTTQEYTIFENVDDNKERREDAKPTQAETEAKNDFFTEVKVIYKETKVEAEFGVITLTEESIEERGQTYGDAEDVLDESDYVTLGKYNFTSQDFEDLETATEDLLDKIDEEDAVAVQYNFGTDELNYITYDYVEGQRDKQNDDYDKSAETALIIEEESADLDEELESEYDQSNDLVNLFEGKTTDAEEGVIVLTEEEAENRIELYEAAIDELEDTDTDSIILGNLEYTAEDLDELIDDLEDLLDIFDDGDYASAAYDFTTEEVVFLDESGTKLYQKYIETLANIDETEDGYENLSIKDLNLLIAL